MNDSDYLFPRYRVTLGEVKACFALTKTEAARKLGVKVGTFITTMARCGFKDSFTGVGDIYFMPAKKITFARVEELAATGHTIDEAAYICNTSRSGFASALRRNKLNKLFPIKRRKKKIEKPRQRARYEHRNSPAEGVELEAVTVPCMVTGCKHSTNIQVWPGSKPTKYIKCNLHKSRESDTAPTHLPLTTG